MGTQGRGDLCSPLRRPSAKCLLLWVFSIAVLMVASSAVHESWALQRHTLLPEQSEEEQAQAPGSGPQQAPAKSGQPAADAPGAPAASGAGHGAPAPAAQQPQAGGAGAAKSAEPHGGQPTAPSHAPQPGKEAGHGEAPHEEAHVGHGPVLPEISPTPGVTFVETMIELMEHELDGRFLGWCPNDIIVGQFTDNVNNYQLGVLEALRFTTLRLKDSLTRMGDADTYDPDLELAVNLFMNRATLFWFPSAETSYGEGVEHLKRFVTRLKGGQRNFYYRVDNLRLLLASYKDLLGNVNKSLIVSPVSLWKTDDYFYYAKGIAHVYYEILRVVRVGYKNQLASTMNGIELMDEILHELHRVEEMEPWFILDGDLDGFVANHRANLNAPLSEVTHLLGILSTF